MKPHKWLRESLQEDRVYPLWQRVAAWGFLIVVAFAAARACGVL
jgi:hypothetical protein